MKRLAVLMAASVMCAWSQTLDFSSLQKLASKAKEANEVNLDPGQIRAAMQFVPQDENNPKLDQTRKLMAGLQSVTVRNYEFEKPGEFQDSDLEPIRAQLARLKGWGKIVDSKEKNERSEVYMLTEDNKTTGLAIVNVEPKELTVVLVRGSIDLADLQKFHGAMGIPSIQFGPQPRPAPKPER